MKEQVRRYKTRKYNGESILQNYTENIRVYTFKLIITLLLLRLYFRVVYLRTCSFTLSPIFFHSYSFALILSLLFFRSYSFALILSLIFFRSYSFAHILSRICFRANSFAHILLTYSFFLHFLRGYSLALFFRTYSFANSYAYSIMLILLHLLLCAYSFVLILCLFFCVSFTFVLLLCLLYSISEFVHVSMCGCTSDY